MTVLAARLARASRELKIFIVASFAIGTATSLFDAIFNNFLNDRFALSGFQRSFLEFPRELPGFLVVFVSAFLWFLCSRRLGAVALLLALVGALLIGFFSSSYAVMGSGCSSTAGSAPRSCPSPPSAWSCRREGSWAALKLNRQRTVANHPWQRHLFVGFKIPGDDLPAHLHPGSALLWAACLADRFMQRCTTPASHHLTCRGILPVLPAGGVASLAQLFITFAPWVLVTMFKQPPNLATLMTIGGLIGILFQPFLGWAIDHLGERRILASEAVLLVVVCFGYGFSRTLFAPGLAFLVACACYLLDQMLMSVSIARSTYMRKIALQPADVQPALTAAVTIDHIFSISVALLGGVIWNEFGYQYVFLLGVGIAVVNFFVALRVRVPHTSPSP
jgi:MFS family permease